MSCVFMRDGGGFVCFWFVVGCFVFVCVVFVFVCVCVCVFVFVCVYLCLWW